MSRVSYMLSEYSPSSEMSRQPAGRSRAPLNTEDSRAVRILMSGLIPSLDGSTSLSSSPVSASWQQRSGAGRSRQGSGAILCTISTALRMKASSASSSMLLVEKLP